MAQDDMLSTDPVDASTLPPTRIDLRRAVLGCLLVSNRPLTIAELSARLVDDFGPDVVAPKPVSDLLRYQLRLGRVRRAGRGAYQIVPGGMAKATAWRCVNWRRERDRRLSRRPAMNARSAAEPEPYGQ